jgi:TonB family protein
MNQLAKLKSGMRKCLVIIPLTLAFVLSGNAQTSVAKKKDATKIDSAKTIKDTIYTAVDKMPQFPNGDSELMRFLCMNIKYPVRAQEFGIQGKVIVQFVINADGKVGNFKILRSVDPLLDNEAIRLLKLMPKWLPGEQNGEKVAVYYILPVVFKAQDSSVPVVFGTKPPESDKTLLYVLDGKPQPKEFDIKSINVKTIQSIKIIDPLEARKDENISKYGPEAENGIVLITLKK